jgi:hypothetical protein
MKTKVTILLIAFITLLCGCKYDDRGCLVPWDTEGTAYLFEVPVSIYPLKNNLKVGDTLMLRVAMSDTISDLREPGKDKHLLENFPLYLVPRIDRLSDDLVHTHEFNYYVDSKEEINIISLKESSKPASEAIDDKNRKYYFVYTPPRYELQLAFVARQKGIYMISFNSVSYPNGCFPWLCTYQTVTARMKVNNDQSNYELLQQRTAGTPWHLARENRGKGYSTMYTIYHDSLPNYQPPRLLLVDYCFEVN